MASSVAFTQRWATASRPQARTSVVAQSASRPSIGRISKRLCCMTACLVCCVCLFSLCGIRPLGRRVFLGTGLATALIAVPDMAKARISILPQEAVPRDGEVRHTEEEWREILGEPAFRVLRQEATERPFSSPLNDEKRVGTFVCAGCKAPLFNSTAKYNSGTGWPSFYAALPGAVDEVSDKSIPFMPRTEIRCHRCKGHLGHVFDDGPRPTGLRYCMNGLALNFEAQEV